MLILMEVEGAPAELKGESKVTVDTPAIAAGAIVLLDASFGVNRGSVIEDGQHTAGDAPFFTGVSCSKKTDASSIGLLKYMMAGTLLGTVTIAMLDNSGPATDANAEAAIYITLKDAVITSLVVQDIQTTFMLEFSHIQINYSNVKPTADAREGVKMTQWNLLKNQAVAYAEA